MSRYVVKLNIYDMYWINDYASVIGVGIYHSGVEVHGVEYAYGGHPFNFSGIFENSPADAEELGENFKFKEAIVLGLTDFAPHEIKKMIQQLGQDYRGDKYHLINKNCNHFSQMFAKTLTGVDIPPWVNRLATMSGSIPFVERWIPQEWLTPVALQQSLDENRTDTNNTMNFPVPVAREALDGYNSPGTSKRGSNATPSFRRGSLREDLNTSNSSMSNGNRSAPNSARSVNGNGLSKWWSSLKSMASESPILSSLAPAPSAQPFINDYVPSTTIVKDSTLSNISNISNGSPSFSNSATTLTTQSSSSSASVGARGSTYRPTITPDRPASRPASSPSDSDSTCSTAKTPSKESDQDGADTMDNE